MNINISLEQTPLYYLSNKKQRGGIKYGYFLIFNENETYFYIRYRNGKTAKKAFKIAQSILHQCDDNDFYTVMDKVTQTLETDTYKDYFMPLRDHLKLKQN